MNVYSNGIYRPRSGWRELALVAVGANALMAVVLIYALHTLGDWLALGKHLPPGEYSNKCSNLMITGASAWNLARPLQ